MRTSTRAALVGSCRGLGFGPAVPQRQPKQSRADLAVLPKFGHVGASSTKMGDVGLDRPGLGQLGGEPGRVLQMVARIILADLMHSSSPSDRSGTHAVGTLHRRARRRSSRGCGAEGRLPSTRIKVDANRPVALIRTKIGAQLDVVDSVVRSTEGPKHLDRQGWLRRMFSATSLTKFCATCT